jgi:hypothetical protein
MKKEAKNVPNPKNDGDENAALERVFSIFSKPGHASVRPCP